MRRIFKFVVFVFFFCVFAVLSPINSPGGNVSIFIETATSILWRLVVFLPLVGFGVMPVLYYEFMLVLGSSFVIVVDFMLD